MQIKWNLRYKVISLIRFSQMLDICCFDLSPTVNPYLITFSSDPGPMAVAEVFERVKTWHATTNTVVVMTVGTASYVLLVLILWRNQWLNSGFITQDGFISHCYEQDWYFLTLHKSQYWLTGFICFLQRHNKILVSWRRSIMKPLSRHSTIHDCRSHLTINSRLTLCQPTNKPSKKLTSGGVMRKRDMSCRPLLGKPFLRTKHIAGNGNRCLINNN
jgi:hypothetical protein